MPERTEIARRYNRIKIRLKLVDISSLIVYLGLFQIFVSPHLKSFAFSFTGNFYCAFTIYIIIFSLLHYIFHFPLHFYGSFILEHKFKLSKQNFYGWLEDEVKGGILSLVLFIVFVQVLYLLLREFGATWWIWMAVFWFFTTVVIAKIMPVLVIPLFFKYSPVGAELKERVVGLAKKCKIKILDVRKIDFSRKTSKLNAALVGLGGTRRVVLADNLADEFSADEVAGVLAHEFGHHKLRHMRKTMAFGVVSIFFSFYILYLFSTKIASFFAASGVYDIRIFPAFMLVLFLTNFLVLPIQNGYSRKLEKEADLFALEVTRDKNAFISLMRKLADKNLADPKPPEIVRFFFYDHPPVSERIEFAESFKA